MSRWMCVIALWVAMVVAGLACGPRTQVKRDDFLNATVTEVNMGRLDRQRIDLTRIGANLRIEILKHDSGKTTYKTRFVFVSSIAASIPEKCNPVYMVKPSGGEPVTLTCKDPDPERNPVSMQSMNESRVCEVTKQQVQWFASDKTMVRSVCADEEPIDYKIPPQAAAELEAALAGRSKT